MKLGECIILLLFVAGCQSKYSDLPQYHPSTQPLVTTGLSEPTPFVPSDAIVDPPVGWVADKLKQEDRYSHQVWKSPTGSTAMGSFISDCRYQRPRPGFFRVTLTR